MPGQFEDKTALVTGGGTGIGRATALALATEGAVVTVAGRTEATLADTVEHITAAGGTARYVVCDVTDEDAVRPRWPLPSQNRTTRLCRQQRRY
jgi:NAD(P)-dependent dehydrogenase (short-subunit alcohol dehydrogenase family)